MDYKYGWIPQRPDARDVKFTVEAPQELQSVDLRDKYKVPAPYNQGQLGSCSGNSWAFLVHFDLLNKHDQVNVTPFQPSRLFIYYYERLIENTVNSDSGAMLRDGIKAISTYGVPSEDLWPYDIDKFTQVPSPEAVAAATQFKAVQYQSVDNSNKQLLVNALLQGFPIAFGLSLYESFESDDVMQTGYVPMPSPSERMIGGHAIAIVGYVKEEDMFIIRNSWGVDWGMNGYCKIPADYICSDQASDFWILTLIQ